MTTIIIGVVLLVIVLSFLVWTLNQMLTYTCPYCLNETGADEILIPVVPNVRWYCPTCSRFTPKSERVARKPDEKGVTYSDLKTRQETRQNDQNKQIEPPKDDKPRFN